MKSLTFLLTSSIVLFAFTFTSCKKKGCTDELAINYRSEYKKDDGSCSYSSTKMVGRYQYTWNDTIIDTADVYSYERSFFEVESSGTFDLLQTAFRFHVDWANKTFLMPDSLVQDIFPDSAKSVTGTIIDQNNFTIQYTHRIPTWNNPSVFKDTVFNYTFERI
jgi:hypothetical protein